MHSLRLIFCALGDPIIPRMPRTNLIVALFALLAAAVFAGPALAHGSDRHTTRAASVVDVSAVAYGERSTEFGLIPNPAGEWFGSALEASVIGVSGHHAAERDCPGVTGSCCVNHCCIGMGLAVGAPDFEPAFASVLVVLPAGGPPSDTSSKPQFRPPCR